MNPQIRLSHLDMLRGIAAFAVFVGHARAFVLSDYHELSNPGLSEKLVYAATGFGHQAVIVFFALSGYLVGGKAFYQIISANWSFRLYMVHRLSRLWTVVLPALAITLVLDQAAIGLGGGAGYQGLFYTQLSSGPSPAGPADHSISTLVGNIAFLQTIFVPVYGSNGPLWSLANEFWYYVLFPVALYVFVPHGTVAWRAMAFITSVIIVGILPFPILALGSIWVFGACAYLVTERVQALGKGSLVILFALIASATLAIAIVSRTQHGLPYDIALGVACAAVLPFLATLPSPGGLYAKLAHVSSEISFTLYVVHFPALAAVYFVLMAPEQLAPGLVSFALLCLLILVVTAFSAGVWWCFERNTALVRRAMKRIVPASGRKVAADS